MKEHKQKEIDLFLKKALKDLELEQAPSNFASTLLAKIEKVQKESDITVYRPLISVYAWWTMGITMFAAGVVLVFNVNVISKEWFSVFRWNTIGNADFLQTIPNIALSDNTIYGVLGLAFFVTVQVWYLKRFFAERQVLL